MITWKELLQFESLCSAKRIKETDKNYLFYTLQSVWAPTTLSSKERLYIVPEHLLPHLLIMEGVSIVVLSETGNPIEPIPEALNTLSLPSEDAEVFQEQIVTSFDRAARMKMEEGVMLELLRNNAGLTAMTEEFSRFLGRPIAVLDTNFTFLTPVPEELLGSLVSEEWHTPEGLSIKGLTELLDDGLVEQALSSSEPLFLPYNDEFSIYHISLKKNGVTIGILGIPGSKEFGNYTLPLEYVHGLRSMADIFSAELSKDELYSNNGQSSLSYIFSMIMEKEPEDIESVRDRCLIYDYHLLPEMYLLFVPLPTETESNPSFLASTLQNVFQNSISLVRNRDILLLITRAEGHPVSDFEREIWGSQLRRLGLNAGLSGIFRDFRSIRSLHLRTAELALSAGLSIDPEEGLYRFDDYQMDSLLSAIGDDQELQFFCFQPLLQLIEYDTLRESHLVETLKIYLENIRSPQTVCEKIFIHRNTLYKRIAKIEEIMGCSIVDPETIMKVQLTFHILGRRAV